MEDSPVILVVEDDPPIQTIVEDALVDGGFEPAIAPSGEEAVTLLTGHFEALGNLLEQARDEEIGGAGRRRRSGHNGVIFS